MQNSQRPLLRCSAVMLGRCTQPSLHEFILVPCATGTSWLLTTMAVAGLAKFFFMFLSMGACIHVCRRGTQSRSTAAWPSASFGMLQSCWHRAKFLKVVFTRQRGLAQFRRSSFRMLCGDTQRNSVHDRASVIVMCLSGPPSEVRSQTSHSQCLYI